MALINEILVARKEFAATFTSSAVGRSARTQGVFASRLDLYNSFSFASAASLTTPTTNRFGFKVSSTAKPSRKNSGFHARSTAGLREISRSRRRWAVPTGTVDFPTTSEPAFAIGAIASSAASTYLRSAASDPVCCGVPTQMK